VKGSNAAVLEVEEIYEGAAPAQVEQQNTHVHARRRGAGRKPKIQYRMRCPKCALGLLEIFPGPVSRDKCTTCNAIWYDYAELQRIAKNDRTGFFQLFD
jgi:hypothetical protein